MARCFRRSARHENNLSQTNKLIAKGSQFEFPWPKEFAARNTRVEEAQEETL